MQIDILIFLMTGTSPLTTVNYLNNVVFKDLVLYMLIWSQFEQKLLIQNRTLPWVSFCHFDEISKVPGMLHGCFCQCSEPCLLPDPFHFNTQYAVWITRLYLKSVIVTVHTINFIFLMSKISVVIPLSTSPRKQKLRAINKRPKSFFKITNFKTICQLSLH